MADYRMERDEREGGGRVLSDPIDKDRCWRVQVDRVYLIQTKL